MKGNEVEMEGEKSGEREGQIKGKRPAGIGQQGEVGRELQRKGVREYQGGSGREAERENEELASLVLQVKSSSLVRVFSQDELTYKYMEGPFRWDNSPNSVPKVYNVRTPWFFHHDGRTLTSPMFN